MEESFTLYRLFEVVEAVSNKSEMMPNVKPKIPGISQN
jgi:hypothetical protein